MGLKSSLIIATALVLSTNVSATLFTHGNLTSDDTTNIISDSLNNVEYLRLDVLADLNYAETKSVLSTQDGGGWNIAGASDAIGFVSAFFGGTSACDGYDASGPEDSETECGTNTGWTDGDFGDNYDGNDDFAWFLDGNDEADFLNIDSNGLVIMVNHDALEDSDEYSTNGGVYSDIAGIGDYDDKPISWLLVRNTTSTVPEPSIALLLASGLIAFGLVRRKRRV